MLGSNSIDEVILSHEMFSVLILPGMAKEVEAGLVRQMRLLGATDQSLLDGILNTRHCARVKRAGHLNN
jgi:hypothetical protein